jgi:hypothetical protein
VANETYPAQIVFIEDDRGGAWYGRLFNLPACLDTGNHGRPVTGTPRFDIIEREDGRYQATMQGGPKGSRRHRTYPTLNAAQKAAIRWAGRRFRVPSGR